MKRHKDRARLAEIAAELLETARRVAAGATKEGQTWLARIALRNSEILATTKPSTRYMLNQLEAKLLTESGDAVVLQVPEPHLMILLTYGALFRGKPLLKRMRASSCHSNMAELRKKRKIDKIATGYGLSRDGLAVWRQHSWGIKDGKIVETTVRRAKYWGVVLDPAEEKRFISVEFR